MICPQCSADNLPERRFCRECGTPLAPRCSRCGAENQPGDKFCGQCGQRLGAVAAPRSETVAMENRLKRIRQQLPTGLVDRILAQRGKIEGEHRTVTVVFCDLAGYTGIAEKTGAEEAYHLMERVYGVLIEKISQYGGTINEMTGDGVMALFGAPISLEDAPQRAIRASLAIHQEIARLGNRPEWSSLPLKMRIGIHTGPVVVGVLGNDLRLEFKAVGDTVNLASRVEGLADPGTTLVSEETFKMTEGLFRFEALGEKKVHRREKPVRVFQVIAASTHRTRFDVGAERGLTPLVGRERELELLLDGFERARQGRGQAFSIVSEAGVGKSRLLYEFRKAVANEAAAFLEGRCFSYSAAFPYFPLADLLGAYFDVHREDPPQQNIRRVRQGLKQLGSDEQANLPVLLELFGIAANGSVRMELRPDDRRARIIETLKRIALNQAEKGVTVIAIEDLHWADRYSEDILKELLQAISLSPVLLIFTYRPEFIHTWGARTYHNQVILNRLCNRESLQMASYLLGGERIGVELEQLILEKTEGVPFFIEEFIKSLVDLKIIERHEGCWNLYRRVDQLTIPATIYDVIMARVDGLAEGAREILQAGAVIGREFSYRLIAALMDCGEKDLMTRLTTLKEAELLYERGIYPQSTYVFKHNLTRDVVLASILNGHRRELHNRIGLALEELHAPQIQEMVEVVADHFIRGRNYDKGALYAKMAGKKAQKAGLFKEAIKWAQALIDCYEKMPERPEIQKKIIDARTVLSGYFTSLGRLVEARQAVLPVEETARRLDYRRRMPAIYTAIGLYTLWVKEDFPETTDYLNRALQIGKEVGNYVSVFLTSYYLGCHYSWNAQFDRAEQCFQRCLKLAEAGGNRIGQAFTKGTESAFRHLFQGKVERALRTSLQAMEIASECGDSYVKGMACSSYGAACFFAGDYRTAEDHLLRGLEFNRQNNMTAWEAWAAGFLAHMYAEDGKFEPAVQFYEKAIVALESTRLLPSWSSQLRIAQARAQVLGGGPAESHSSLCEYYRNIRVQAARGWASLHIAEILMRGGASQLAEAERWARQAVELDESGGTLFQLAWDYALLGRIFLRQEKEDRAVEFARRAERLFAECGAGGGLRRVRQFASRLRLTGGPQA